MQVFPQCLHVLMLVVNVCNAYGYRDWGPKQIRVICKCRWRTVAVQLATLNGRATYHALHFPNSPYRPLGHYAITTANSGRAAGPFSSLNSNWDSESSSGRAHACHVIHTFCWRSISPLLTLSLGTFLSLSPGIFLPLSIWVSLSTYLPLIAFQPSISRWSCCSFCLPVGSTSVSHSFSRALREKKILCLNI